MAQFSLSKLARRRAPILLGALLFVLMALLVEYFVEIQHRTAELKLSVEIQNDLYRFTHHLEQRVNLLLFRSFGLEAYIRARKGDLDEKDVIDLMATLHYDSHHIRNLGLAKETTISYVYPLEGNERALGLDYRQVPDQWPSVEKAMNSVAGVLAGPVKLVQGGIGMIYRYPIRVDGEYWGLLSTVVDKDSFFQALAENHTTDKSQIAVRTTVDGESVPLLGNPEIFDHPLMRRILVDVPGGYWEVGAAPLIPPSEPLTGTIRFAGWIFSILLGIGLSTILLQRRELERLALVDVLTGIANRRQFDLMLERFCDRYNRRNSGRFVIMFLDLDHFKLVNDRHGHKAGDFVLQQISQRISNVTRGSDVLARWGGDEFAIILDNPSTESVEQLIERLRDVTELPVEWRGEDLIVGVSIGVVSYPEEGMTPEALLGAADKMMYTDKQGRQMEMRSR